MLSRAVTSGLAAASWFSDPRAPYLVLDRDLRIRAVNTAYERATGHPREVLLGEHLFDAFPDNPADPASDGVPRLAASIEHVLRRGRRSWMPYQRYDVPDRATPGSFVLKVWAPVNSPVTEDGRTVAVLHHVQDVTGSLQAVAPGSVAGVRSELGGIAALLAHQFPEVTHEAVVGVLTQAELLVLDTLGTPDLERTAALARLRLELRTGHPARPEGDAGRADRSR